MTGPDYCSVSAIGEPMAGTAPTQTHLLFVEAPGKWGREALADCSLPAAQREALLQLPEQWRVVLVRRPDRPLRRQRDRFVWVSLPEGPARIWRVPLTASVLPQDLPAPGALAEDPTLFLCTHGGRDRCCALFGRRLFEHLVPAVGSSQQIWECSHLGGHRFAPTALRLSDRTLFGRLTQEAAQQVLAGHTPAGFLRGPVGWPPEVQVAAVAVWSQNPARVAAMAMAGPGIGLQLSDGSSWQVPVAPARTPERIVSCGAEPRVDMTLLAGRPMPAATA